MLMLVPSFTYEQAALLTDRPCIPKADAAEVISAANIIATALRRKKQAQASVVIQRRHRMLVARQARRHRLALRYDPMVVEAIKEAFTAVAWSVGCKTGMATVNRKGYLAQCRKVYLINMLDKDEGNIDINDCFVRANKDWISDAQGAEQLDERLWSAGWFESMTLHAEAANAKSYCAWSRSTIRRLTVRTTARTVRKAHAKLRAKVKELKRSCIAKLQEAEDSDEELSSGSEEEDEEDDDQQESTDEEEQDSSDDQADDDDEVGVEPSQVAETKDGEHGSKVDGSRPTCYAWMPDAVLLQRIARSPAGKAAGLTKVSLGKVLRRWERNVSECLNEEHLGAYSSARRCCGQAAGFGSSTQIGRPGSSSSSTGHETTSSTRSGVFGRSPSRSGSSVMASRRMPRSVSTECATIDAACLARQRGSKLSSRSSDLPVSRPSTQSSSISRLSRSGRASYERESSADDVRWTMASMLSNTTSARDLSPREPARHRGDAYAACGPASLSRLASGASSASAETHSRGAPGGDLTRSPQPPSVEPSTAGSAVRKRKLRQLRAADLEQPAGDSRIPFHNNPLPLPPCTSDQSEGEQHVSATPDDRADHGKVEDSVEEAWQQLLRRHAAEAKAAEEAREEQAADVASAAVLVAMDLAEALVNSAAQLVEQLENERQAEVHEAAAAVEEAAAAAARAAAWEAEQQRQAEEELLAAHERAQAEAVAADKAAIVQAAAEERARILALSMDDIQRGVYQLRRELWPELRWPTPRHSFGMVPVAALPRTPEPNSSALGGHASSGAAMPIKSMPPCSRPQTTEVIELAPWITPLKPLLSPPPPLTLPQLPPTLKQAHNEVPHEPRSPSWVHARPWDRERHGLKHSIPFSSRQRRWSHDDASASRPLAAARAAVVRPMQRPRVRSGDPYLEAAVLDSSSCGLGRAELAAL